MKTMLKALNSVSLLCITSRAEDYLAPTGKETGYILDWSVTDTETFLEAT